MIETLTATASGKETALRESHADLSAAEATPAGCRLGNTEFWTRSSHFLHSIRKEPGFQDLVHALGIMYLSKFGKGYPAYLREALFKEGKSLFAKTAPPLRKKYHTDFINTFEVFYNKIYGLESYPENMQDAKRLEVSVMLGNDFGPLIKFVELDRLFEVAEALESSAA